MLAYYFDSGVFVTPMLKNRDQTVIQECIDWMRRIERGELIAYTSTLTWDEVTYIAGRSKGAYDRSMATRAGSTFRTLPNLRFVPVDEAVLQAAQRLLDQIGLRPRDCIHASSALLYTSGSFVTLDVGDFQSKAASVGLSLHAIS